MNTYFQEIAPLAADNGIPWGGYFGLFFLFLLIIGFGVWLVFFSKWLKYGPVFKRFFRKMKAKITGKMDKSGPKIQKGAVISNEIQITKLDDEIIQAKTPQELLAAQNKKIHYEKEVQILEAKIVEDQEKAKAKEEEKLENQEIKQQLKDERQQAKAEHAQAKQEKKDNKKGSKE